MHRAIKAIKNTAPEMEVLTDVALDPYSSFGHDGIVENNACAMMLPWLSLQTWHVP